MTLSQKCTLKAKVANNILDCFRESTPRRLRDVTLTLCSALAKPHMKCCVQFWAPQHKKDMDIVEQVHQRVIKIIKGLEYISYEVRWFGLEKRRLRGDVYTYIKI